MSVVSHLKLLQVRSHNEADYEFSPTMNAIVGPNGSGKTTILEALYTLMKGSSFRGSIGEILQYGKHDFRIAAELGINLDQSRSLGFQRLDVGSVKQWKVENKKYARLPLMARYPVVLFEPDFSKLVTGSPERRRQYLDGITGQLDIEIAVAQNRFERTLRQRNQLLKQLAQTSSQPRDELFIWNTQLARLSEVIVKSRLELLKNLQAKISDYYQQLGGHDQIFLSYRSDVSSDAALYASRLLQFLETSLQRDIVLGHTSFGPHRDEIEIRLADQPANERASRGEVRSIVIALKLLETELLAKHFQADNKQPLLLLDDVLSELDLNHQAKVLEGFKNYQVFITTTDAHTLTPGIHTIAL